MARVALLLTALLLATRAAAVREYCSRGCCCENQGFALDRGDGETPRCRCQCVGAWVPPLCSWREVELGRVRVVFRNTSTQPFVTIDEKLLALRTHYGLGATSTDIQRVSRVVAAEPANKTEIHYMLAFRGLLAERFLNNSVSVYDPTDAHATHGWKPATWQRDIGVLKAWVFVLVDAPAGPYAGQQSIGDVDLGGGVKILFPLAALEWFFGPLAFIVIALFLEYLWSYCGLCRKAWIKPSDPDDILTADVSLDQDDFTELELQRLEMEAGITPTKPDRETKTPQNRSNPMKPPH